MAVQFFVPLAVAGAKIFFKFASKRAAQTFKSNYAKAGKITTKTPPKSATVTTTGSQKGKSVLKDLKSPVTAPSVRARNPNTTTLPKKPAGGGTGKKAAGAAAIGAGVVAGSKATSKDADKPKSKTNNRSTSQGGRSRDQVIAENQKRLARKSAAQGGGSVLSGKKKTGTSSTTVSDSQKKNQTSTRKKVSKPTPPPPRPKKNDKPASTSRPTAPPSGRKTKKKMYTAINTRTGKPDYDAPRVTAAQRLKQEDEYKKFKKDSAKFRADATREYITRTAKKNMSNGGAALKAVPAGNKGLKKLPTAVRNRMGFMRKGGVAKRK